MEESSQKSNLVHAVDHGEHALVFPISSLECSIFFGPIPTRQCVPTQLVVRGGAVFIKYSLHEQMPCALTRAAGRPGPEDPTDPRECRTSTTTRLFSNHTSSNGFLPNLDSPFSSPNSKKATN